MPAVIPAAGAAAPRAAKRQKLRAAADPPRGPPRPRIFAPFRTVGLVSPTDVPFTAVPLGKTTFQITTCVGRSLQTYDLRKGLNLVFITRPQTPTDITATAAWNDKVLAAWGGESSSGARGVWIFKRGKKVGELEIPHGFTEPVRQLVIFGSWIVARCITRIEIWNSASLEHYASLYSQRGGKGDQLTDISNMPTYVNKIFAGRGDGTVEIWNIRTGKLIYTLYAKASDYGAVTALQPTPALSLLAIAYQNGPVVIQDIRSDKEVLSLNAGASSSAPITSISFRTDGMGAGDEGRRAGVMATSSKQSGDVTFWDLNDGGRKMSVLRGAHNPPSNTTGESVKGGVGKVEFLAGQAIVLTSGLDNSLKTWIFDESPFSPVPRILHSRSGHAAPVCNLQFLPSDADGADAGGKWLLSASRDRSLWGWSLRRDGQSTELSQGNIRKKAKKMGLLSSGNASMDSSITLEDLKAPKITCMACSLNRDGGMGAVPSGTAIWTRPTNTKGVSNATESGSTGWESVVTGHKGDKIARTWFWGRKRAGRWAFETGDGTPVTSVAISPCGTFALIGSEAGGIDMYNLQSGVHRQRYPARLTQTQAKRLKAQQDGEVDLDDASDKPKKFARGQGKHTKAVTGIVVDGLNRTVISCGEDGKLKFWDFATGLLLHQIDWYPMTGIVGIRYHRPSDLIALSCDDGSIRVVDIETKRLIRELWNSGSRTIDYLFSNDGRWVIGAFADSTIRVWDLPTGHLIDAMKLQSPCTAIAFSNTGEYLATALEDSVGVHLWTNRTLFTHVPTRHISDKEIAEIALPTASGEEGETIVSAANLSDEETEDAESEGLAVPTLDQLSESITTLSLVPKSRWQTLLHLDLIRSRNKPKESIKAPEKAPFFLPSLQNGTGPAARPSLSTNPTPQEPATASALTSRLLASSSLATTTSDFSKLLHAAAASEDAYAPMLAHLSNLPPSAADLAIRTLDPTAPYTEMLTFIHALTARLRARRDFELVQAWIAVFLRLHGDIVTTDESLVEALREWREEAGRERERLGKLVGFCGGVVGWLRAAR